MTSLVGDAAGSLFLYASTRSTEIYERVDLKAYSR